MDVLLTESQYKKLLFEEKKSEIEKEFDKSKDVTFNIISDIKKQYGIDFTFALTWGATIGGFVGPIQRYLETTYTNLSSSDITLICFGIILTFFSSNKEKLQKVLKLIKEKGIITFFDRAIMKSYDLKDSFISFLESLNMTFSKTSNMLAYAFLVPLVPFLKHISDMDMSDEEMMMLINGITHYSVVLVSSTILTQLISKIIKRFKS